MIAKKFQQLPRIVQFILLLIPVVNWVTEIVVRLSALINKPDLYNIIGIILAILPTGVILGWVDLVWVLLFKQLFLARV